MTSFARTIPLGLALALGVADARAASSGSSDAPSPSSSEPDGAAEGRPDEQTRHCLEAGAEVFAGYRDGTVGGARGSEFFLDRAELGVDLTWRGEAAVESGVAARAQAIRSAGPQSLFGIDGDSIVLRMLEAYGHGAVRLGELDLRLRLGLVPERWIELQEESYDLRALEALVSDRRFLDRSDLGVTVTATAFDGLVTADVSVVNGEGPAQRELNRGKTTTAIVTLRPIRGDLSWGLHAGVREGSRGVGSARDHRLAAASTLRAPRFSAGAEYVHAFGLGGDAALNSQALGGWVSATLFAPHLGVAGTYDLIDEDRATSDATVQRISAGLFVDSNDPAEPRRLRLYLAYQHERFGDAAGALPGAPDALDSHLAIILLHARGTFVSSEARR